MKDRHVIIIGAGHTIKQYKNQILKYIEKNSALTIGINMMTSLCVPNYHLWTNKQRYKTQYHCIDKKSKLLFGNSLSDKLVRKYWEGDFERINHINDKSAAISYNKGVIRGNFRTAGILAIMIAHVRGANKIDVVGMDGFTLYNKKDVIKKRANQHCYGKGHTDDASWEECLEKDRLVDDGLHALKDYGVEFEIITPTKFKDFCNLSVLDNV